jgi:hypothetical protein
MSHFEHKRGTNGYKRVFKTSTSNIAGRSNTDSGFANPFCGPNKRTKRIRHAMKGSWPTCGRRLNVAQKTWHWPQQTISRPYRSCLHNGETRSQSSPNALNSVVGNRNPARGAERSGTHCCSPRQSCQGRQIEIGPRHPTDRGRDHDWHPPGQDKED